MSASPKIGAYEFGRIEIDGQNYTADVIILPTGVKPNWWRNEGHRLRPEDLALVLDATPQVLVVGQGAYGYMAVTDAAFTCLQQAGIEAVCLPTGQAVHVYNERSGQGQPIAAALHLTC